MGNGAERRHCSLSNMREGVCVFFSTPLFFIFHATQSRGHPACPKECSWLFQVQSEIIYQEFTSLPHRIDPSYQHSLCVCVWETSLHGQQRLIKTIWTSFTGRKNLFSSSSSIKLFSLDRRRVIQSSDTIIKPVLLSQKPSQHIYLSRGTFGLTYTKKINTSYPGFFFFFFTEDHKHFRIITQSFSSNFYYFPEPACGVWQCI